MSKRGENITKRKDGRWEARYIKGYENGKAVYGYLYGKSYAEAKQKKEEALRSSRELSHSKRTETFNDLLDCFLIQNIFLVSLMLRFWLRVYLFLSKQKKSRHIDSTNSGRTFHPLAQFVLKLCNGLKFKHWLSVCFPTRYSDRYLSGQYSDFRLTMGTNK